MPLTDTFLTLLVTRAPGGASRCVCALFANASNSLGRQNPTIPLWATEETIRPYCERLASECSPPNTVIQSKSAFLSPHRPVSYTSLLPVTWFRVHCAPSAPDEDATRPTSSANHLPLPSTSCANPTQEHIALRLNPPRTLSLHTDYGDERVYNRSGADENLLQNPMDNRTSPQS